MHCVEAPSICVTEILELGLAIPGSDDELK